jgi:hypothetical protein
MIDWRSDSMKTPIPGWLPYANRLIVWLQNRGLAIGTMQVLAVPGRKTGRFQETPLSPFCLDVYQYVVAGFDAADWVRNVRASGWAELRRGRDSRRVKLTELPVDERGRVLRAFPEKVPHGTQFFDRLYGVGNDPDKFAALAPKCPVFRIESPERSEIEPTN